MKLSLAAASAALMLSLGATATPQATPATEPVFPTAPTLLNGQQVRFAVSPLQPEQTILECERAIYVLKTGHARQWQTPERYIDAFKKFTAAGSSQQERELMIAYLTRSLPERHAMDEQTPLDVQVTRTIHALEESRDWALAIEAKASQ